MAGQNPWNFDQFDQSRSAAEPSSPAAWTPQAGSGLGTRPPEVDFGFADETSAGGLEIGRPPVLWLGLAAGSAVVSILVAGLLGLQPLWALVAWIIGGPIAIGLLALFTLRDTAAQTQPVYARPGWLRGAYAGCLVLCGVAVVVSAVRIAWWVGTR